MFDIVKSTGAVSVSIIYFLELADNVAELLLPELYM